MKHDVLQDAQEYTKARQRKKRWYSIVTCLAVMVVFCTIYVLILPAITMEKSQCEIPEHTHNENCFAVVETIEENVAETIEENVTETTKHVDTETQTCEVTEGEKGDQHSTLGYDNCELICGLDEHTHDEKCQSEKVIADQPTELEQSLCEQIESDYPALIEDSAFVSELTITEAKVLSASTESVAHRTVCNQDTIAYGFLVRTQSYTDTCFSMGRVKLEFVLPTSSNQAIFDLSSMPWLDRSEGYAPVVTTENRVMNETEVSCQVLTGYKLLSQENGSHVIPGEFTEVVAVCVLSMNPGDSLAVQISAAMEHNTWDGSCQIHNAKERLTVSTDVFTVVTSLSEEELQTIDQEFGKEMEKTEESIEPDGEALSDVETIAEAAEGSNWILLRDSGWFEAYSNYDSSTNYALTKSARFMQNALESTAENSDSTPPSDVQVKDRGGANVSEDGAVTVSKTISGTDLENVFDITLQVQTSVNVAEIKEEPDMAVVIIMDISNTMNSDFGGETRYAAAMSAAEDFLDNFVQNNSLGISKVGYVAFNTDAHQIFSLQPCSTQEQADALKNIMRTQTGSIINATGYNEMHTRFTNVEAGLAMGADMLKDVTNKNKFIIFLSDGFPTTYISNGYSGYDPYDSTGRFYDHVLNKKCLYGTSYSDEAAIRARNMATTIKNDGITIFSIGVDVAGQTIQKYITQSENANGFSVVDRTSTSYEIGDASSTEAYKNWLKNSIGSGYYYDSTDLAGLQTAYDNILAEIKHKVEAGIEADWVTSDPIPTVSGLADTIEFIGFYNKDPALVDCDLTGQHTVNGENTAKFDGTKFAISWDLKQSGYQVEASGGTTTYIYQLVYRVRLKNETDSFEEGTVYLTNDPTILQYRNIESTDGNLTISDSKTVNFPIPSVHGYVAELVFQKVDTDGNPLVGAEFTLEHDCIECSICRGDGTSVEIPIMTAVSDNDGTVSFTRITSGHKYLLKETKVPDGYAASGDSYHVDVAYDKVTVIVKTLDGTDKDWTGKVENHIYYELPSTGGSGTTLYTMGGLLLIATASLLLLYYHIKRRKDIFTTS